MIDQIQQDDIVDKIVGNKESDKEILLELVGQIANLREGKIREHELLQDQIQELKEQQHLENADKEVRLRKVEKLIDESNPPQLIARINSDTDFVTEAKNKNLIKIVEDDHLLINDVKVTWKLLAFIFTVVGTIFGMIATILFQYLIHIKAI